MIAGLFVSGCSITNHSNSPTYLSSNSQKVSAEKSYFSPLYLFPENVTNELIDELANQCGDQGVSGISIDVQRRFWSFVGENVTLVANGYCGK